MNKVKKDTGLSPEQVEKIKAAQKRHSAIDPGCEKLSPEEFINWHPLGGISWEERARRMREAGVAPPASSGENEEQNFLSGQTLGQTLGQTPIAAGK
jgi:hypothetical protein